VLVIALIESLLIFKADIIERLKLFLVFHMDLKLICGVLLVFYVNCIWVIRFSQEKMKLSRFRFLSSFWENPRRNIYKNV